MMLSYNDPELDHTLEASCEEQLFSFNDPEQFFTSLAPSKTDPSSGWDAEVALQPKKKTSRERQI